MEITKANDVHTFQPVIITIKLESPDEVQAMRDFAYYAHLGHTHGLISQTRLNKMTFLHNYLCLVAHNSHKSDSCSTNL